MDSRVKDLYLQSLPLDRTQPMLYDGKKIGDDANYIFQEILPRLNSGVLVHVHDILFPFNYRRDWLVHEYRFWTEQYLLQLFLAFNLRFEVLVANKYLAHRYLDNFKTAFPTSSCLRGGSFWMRWKPGTAQSPQSVAGSK
jgi:hypothetical protein